MNQLTHCLDDALLLQVSLDGAEDLQRHVSGCGGCRRRLARLQRERRSLTAVAERVTRVDGGSPAPLEEPDVRPEAEAPLAQVGRYRIRGRLGSGGQADVYLAQHPTLGCDVVVKVARQRLARSVETQSRIEAEGRLLAAIRHPGLPRVLDLDVHEDRPFLVLELVNGRRLDEQAQGRATAETKICAWMLDLAQAVLATHRQGVLHLDLKPENVMIGADGRARLIDFGTARLLTAGRCDRNAAIIVGTPEYMAPEQHSGDASQLTPATDVYGLGGVLYYLLFGEPPHPAGRALPTFQPIAASSAESGQPSAEPPITRSVTRRSLRDALVSLCRIALQRDPAARFADVEVFAGSLRAVGALTVHPRRRRRVAAALVELGLVSLTFALGWRPSPPAQAAAQVAPASCVELLATIAAGHRRIALLDAGPLEAGDRLYVTVRSPVPNVTGLFLVYRPDLVIPCLPLRSATDAHGHLVFPVNERGWLVSALPPVGLLVAGIGHDGRAPSTTSLSRALRATTLQLPVACEGLAWRDPTSSPGHREELAAWLDALPDAASAAAVRRLQAALDLEFDQYEAILFSSGGSPEGTGMTPSVARHIP